MINDFFSLYAVIFLKHKCSFDFWFYIILIMLLVHTGILGDGKHFDWC